VDYQKNYYSLISSRKQLKRSKKNGTFERHHITPKAFGGSDNADNLVLLTPREHYIAHLLLMKMYTGVEKAKMTYALYRMCSNNPSQKRVITSKQYEYVRNQITLNCTGINNPRFGIALFTDEQKKKISQNMLGEKNHRFGKVPHNKGKTGFLSSEETKKKISQALTGKKRPLEVRAKISKEMSGLKKSEEHKAKLSLANKGKKLKQETKEKMSKERKGMKVKEYICPHCGKKGKSHAMFRWHFNECKYR
jgi:hypothetical protein